MATTKIPGWEKLRGIRGLELHREIVRLRKDEKKSIIEISRLLKLSKKSVLRNMYNNGNRLFAKRLIDNSAIDCFIAISDAMEISQIHMEVTNVLMQAGELHFTPEQFGTHIRSTEHLMDLFKMLNGRSITFFKDQGEESKDPELVKAKERLKELESKALNGKTIEASKVEPAEDDDEQEDDD